MGVRTKLPFWAGYSMTVYYGISGIFLWCKYLVLAVVRKRIVARWTIAGLF